jgi:acyl-CoA hydrolase
MENHKLILPEHLNHYGFLFGGHLLKWVDETAWIAASLDYPGCNFVTVAMDHVEFRESVKQGVILKFTVTKTRAGRTSVSYRVEVYRANSTAGEDGLIFITLVTFVRIDRDGNKLPLPSLSGSATAGPEH